MAAYCDRQSVAAESVVFLFEGERLRGDQTPQDVRSLYAVFAAEQQVSSLEYGLHMLQVSMEDGDSIDVVIHQVGGCKAL